MPKLKRDPDYKLTALKRAPEYIKVIIKVWLNEGQLAVGDDIIFLLIDGDIRPHVVDAIQLLIGKIKTECVTEIKQNT